MIQRNDQEANWRFQVPALPLTLRVTLGKLRTPLSFSFPLGKVGMVILSPARFQDPTSTVHLLLPTGLCPIFFLLYSLSPNSGKRLKGHSIAWWELKLPLKE